MDEFDTPRSLEELHFVSGFMQAGEQGLTGSESTEGLFIL